MYSKVSDPMIDDCSDNSAAIPSFRNVPILAGSEPVNLLYITSVIELQFFLATAEVIHVQRNDHLLPPPQQENSELLATGWN